jgi:hypothetical protein
MQTASSSAKASPNRPAKTNAKASNKPRPLSTEKTTFPLKRAAAAFDEFSRHASRNGSAKLAN